MVQKEHVVRKKTSIPESFFVTGTVEHPTNVQYSIKIGTTVVDEGDAFPGAHLTIVGDGNNDLTAVLNSITHDCGHFTSCEPTYVRTANYQEVPKPRGWKFSASLSAARVDT